MLSNERIPNNVDLSENRRLQRALEHWQPRYLDWWREMGPDGFQNLHEIYLRTAISAEADGWAHFEHVRLPEYRWGIFLTPPVQDRTIGFGDSYGQPVWQEVPGEFRNSLRRLIVTQGDTEPASVEQQRLLGHCCPSLYDLRNLFQVNVEEGRHLWAMVYLLHSYFGRDGREEAEALLERRSGNEDKPRILQAFNEPIENWLDFFMFTTFTDRDGKYQLLALSESAFDPLARTTKFMLTEEAHHMFVGETGIGRVLRRTAELMKAGSGLAEDVRRAGGIDLPTLQRHINFWFSVSLDLFGGENSSNAANYFASGLKGRDYEDKRPEHIALDATYALEMAVDGKMVVEDIPLRNAMNEVLRDGYASDCQKAVERWNRVLEQEGLSDRVSLPHRRFHRSIGIHAEAFFDPKGNPIGEAEWNAKKNEWIPTAEDRQFVMSLMNSPVLEVGKMANWIAAPTRGINGLAADYEYVRTDA